MNKQVKDFIAHAIAEAAGVAIQNMAAAGTSSQNSAEPIIHGPIMKDPTFDQNTKDKHAELRNFEHEVSNMLQTFIFGQTERVLVIKNWQGREGLWLTVTLTQE